MTAPPRPRPAQQPFVPRDQRRALAGRFALVSAIALLIGGVNWALQASAGRRLDASMVYALAISWLSWLLIDVGRYALRSPLGAAAPGYWPPPRRAAGLVAAGIAIGYVGGTAIGDAYLGRSTWQLLSLDPGRFTGLLLASLAVSGGFIAYFHQRGRSEALARQAREAQLRLLQSQLEPHMLFNTLANLRVLIGIDPPRAQSMLDHLNAFLRATLAASRREHHALSDEFARLDDYLALMRVRMGPRLHVRLELPDALRELPVPTLLLQPLVENAIRHGLEPRVEGGRLEIRAERHGRTLRLAVRDTGIGLGADGTTAGGGFGTRHVRERLAALHGARATLTIAPADDADGGTLAVVELPIDQTKETTA